MFWQKFEGPFSNHRWPQKGFGNCMWALSSASISIKITKSDNRVGESANNLLADWRRSSLQLWLSRALTPMQQNYIWFEGKLLTYFRIDPFSAISWIVSSLINLGFPLRDASWTEPVSLDLLTSIPMRKTVRGYRIINLCFYLPYPCICLGCEKHARSERCVLVMLAFQQLTYCYKRMTTNNRMNEMVYTLTGMHCEKSATTVYSSRSGKLSYDVMR